MRGKGSIRLCCRCGWVRDWRLEVSYFDEAQGMERVRNNKNHGLWYSMGYVKEGREMCLDGGALYLAVHVMVKGGSLLVPV
jgi:hypothetical protein